MTSETQFIHSFPPIANDNARVLILGSMPGVQSLKKGEYYGNPRNQFWSIISSLLKEKPPTDYSEKTSLLINNKIALWDVAQTCLRQGSMDSAIKEVSPNDLPTFIAKHPDLKLIAFNGTKAHALFKKFFGFEDYPLDFKLLPSTSPTPWRYNKSFQDKLEDWRVIIQNL